MAFTPQEIALLRGTGQTWLFRGLTTPLMAAFIYGVSIPLAIYASIVLRPLAFNKRSAQLMHWGILACLLLNTLHLAGELAKISMDFDLATPLGKHANNIKALTVDLGYLNDRSWNAFLVRNWVDSVGLILSDAVVIWRTCVLLPTRQTWAIIPPVFLLIASGTLSMTACVVGSTVKGSQVATSHWKDIFNTLTETGYILSFTSNVLATLVFGWRLKRLREMRAQASLTRSAVQNTLCLLAESGIVFCTIQLAVIIILPFSILKKIKTLPEALVFDIITRGQYAFSIIYPILVVVLVRSRNSAADTYTTCGTPETLTTNIASPQANKFEDVETR